MSGSSVNPQDPISEPQRPRSLLLLAAVILLESLALVAAVVVLVVELITAVPDSYASAVGLIVLSAIGAAWLVAIAVNTLRGRAWIRGAVITTQVLLIAVAIGSFQGLFARADVGWLLLVPAVVALVLLFTRSVVAATSARDR